MVNYVTWKSGGIVPPNRIFGTT